MTAATSNASAPTIKAQGTKPLARGKQRGTHLPLTPTKATHPREPDQREIIACVMDEHIGFLSHFVPAGNIIAARHSIGRLRSLVDEMKALEGWTWQFDASHFFRDDPHAIDTLIGAHTAAALQLRAAEVERESIEGREPHLYPINQRVRFAAFEAANPDYKSTVERQSAACEDEEEAFNALLRAAAAHPSNFMALARYACEMTEEREGRAVEGASPAYRMLAAFAGLPCLTGANGEPVPAAPRVEIQPDPIFEAIEAHRAAHLASDDPAKSGAQLAAGGRDDINPLFDVYMRTWHVLLATEPTTPAGALALVAYLGEHESQCEKLPDSGPMCAELALAVATKVAARFAPASLRAA